jgi:hypothetical protein
MLLQIANRYSLPNYHTAANKETFRVKGQAQYIDYLDNITGPQGRGHWTLSTNHLAPNNPAPQIWCTWEGAYRIQDAVLMQDYPPPTGANGKARIGIPTYPVTLLWYPKIRQDSDSWSLSSFSWAMAEKSLLPAKGSSPGLQPCPSPPRDPAAAAAAPPEAPPAPRAPVKTAANGKAKEAHKRQISQAIPRNERDNGELSRPNVAPASSRSTQEGTQAGAREGAQEGTQEGTRKSVRARKPKSRS